MRAPTPNIYFRHLDGLRFLAAAAVVVHHLEQFKFIGGAPNAFAVPGVYAVGGFAVTMFFVLSGFLITHLLLLERKATATIAVRDFYVRRVLRIWPLYFLVTFIAFLILPMTSWLPAIAPPPIPEQWLLYLFFMPNVALVCFPAVAYAAQLWSIGVEEQFYLVWPVVVKAVDRLVPLLGCFAAGFAALRFGLTASAAHGWVAPGATTLAYNLLDVTRIDCMAIGGLAACLLAQGKTSWHRLVFSRSAQVALYAALGVLVLRGTQFGCLTHTVHATILALVIANLALNEQTVIRLDHPWLRYLGRISYGVYMYHPLAIGAVLAAFGVLHVSSAGPWLYLVVFATTIGVAAFSYEVLERRFIAMKARFTAVPSGAATALKAA